MRALLLDTDNVMEQVFLESIPDDAIKDCVRLRGRVNTTLARAEGK